MGRPDSPAGLIHSRRIVRLPEELGCQNHRQLHMAQAGDLDLERIADRCGRCGAVLGFEDLYAEVMDATKLRLS